jgi:circadian clock protein KaiB
MSEIRLTLYVTGRTSRSERAIYNLQRIAQETSMDDCELSVVDVLEQPHLAEEERIIATPTLVKSSPPPVRRIIGDLSDIEEVALRLGLGEGASAAGGREVNHA